MCLTDIARSTPTLAKASRLGGRAYANSGEVGRWAGINPHPSIHPSIHPFGQRWCQHRLLDRLHPSSLYNDSSALRRSGCLSSLRASPSLFARSGFRHERQGSLQLVGPMK
mmetsp:Transcript_54522/g.119231  ORF Transcript_54522/g.119231 Transcript_54522/m.119231 type:complete len:111 (+) Transcript_54522:105-437(+)